MKATVREIFETGERIGSTWRRGQTPVREQICARFGITPSEWTRTRVVYQYVLAAEGDDEDNEAAELVARVDSGEITIATAYRLLKERSADEALRAHMPRVVKVDDVRRAMLANNAFLREVEAALRLGVPLELPDGDPDALRRCAAQFRTTAVLSRRIAQQLQKEAPDALT